MLKQFCNMTDKMLKINKNLKMNIHLNKPEWYTVNQFFLSQVGEFVVPWILILNRNHLFLRKQYICWKKLVLQWNGVISQLYVCISVLDSPANTNI